MESEGSLNGDDEVDWQQAIETMPQIVWITRPDGWHTHFNRKWLEFTGLTLQESVGFGWNPPFHPDDRERAAARWARATATGEPYEIEYRLRRADGVYHWMLGRAMPLRDATGQIVRWFGTCTDIEDLKRAQDELERSRTLHRLAGSMARLGGWSIDVARNTLVWSEEIYEVLEFPRGEQPDLAASLRLYLPEHRPALQAAVLACASEGTAFDLELQLRTFAGHPLWVRVMGEPRRGRDGTITHVSGALQDVSAAREARRQNEALADRLATTLESITDAFYTLDREWRFTYLNGHAEQLLQRRREELLGTTFWDEFPATRGTELETAYCRAMHDEVAVVLDEYYYPPLESWFQVNAYPSAQGLAVYFQDVTAQRRDRQDLEERVKELRALATISGGAHELTDARQLCELVARSLCAAMQHPEVTGVVVVLDDVVAKDGVVAPDAATFATPVVVAGEDHGRIVVSEGTGAGLLPEEEDLVRAVATTLGLWQSRHRAAEALRRANDELNQANRQLAEAARVKDDLLSMASHELRTPLTPILGFLELLEARADDLDDGQRQMVHSMHRNATRMLHLVDDLLTVSRAAANVLVPRPADVNAADVLPRVLDELGDALPEVELAVDGCRLRVDPEHLQQVLTNLLTNATKYGAGPIVVRAVPAATGRVAIEVADHGPGVPANFQARMWERFEQKDRGDRRTASGTGLGLAIVRLLVEANDGTVGYRDGTPSGAVFIVELPGRVASGRRHMQGSG